MRSRIIIDGRSKPVPPVYVRLQFDTLRRCWVLLAPERVMWPDGTSVDILKKCDGVSTTDEIVAKLASDYAAPEEEIRKDVTSFLQEWADKRLIICANQRET